MKPLALINFSGGLGEGLALNAAIISISAKYNLEYFITNIDYWIRTNQSGAHTPATKNTYGWLELFKNHEKFNFLTLFEDAYVQNFHNSFVKKITISNGLCENLDQEIDYNKINQFTGTNQDTRFWFPYFGEIKKSLKLNYFNFDEDAVVIHVRRTDWVGASWHFIDLCMTDYYKNAIKMADSKKIIFVSDDIAWVKEWFESFSNELVYDSVDFCDTAPISAFEIMMNAKKLVISQSTFSRWAAYLNNNIVFYPELFYKNQPTPDLRACKDTNKFHLDGKNWLCVKYI